MSNLRSVVLATACLGFAASALAEPADTVSASIMHRTPNVHSRVVQEIPANARIDLSSCSRGWCYASWRDLFGYVPADAIAGSLTPVVAPPPVIVARPVAVAPPWGWGGPYARVGWGWGWGW
jgi:hypothetical protein